MLLNSTTAVNYLVNLSLVTKLRNNMKQLGNKFCCWRKKVVPAWLNENKTCCFSSEAGDIINWLLHLIEVKVLCFSDLTFLKTICVYNLHSAFLSVNWHFTLRILGDLKLVEKPQPIMLGPNDFSNIKVSILLQLITWTAM